MGLMIQRYALTGNDSYNDIITQAMLHQVGDNNDFTPSNQSVDLVVVPGGRQLANANCFTQGK